MGVTSIAGSVSPRNSQVGSFFETKGRSASVSARLYFNKLVYGFVRHTRKMPDRGWIGSRWHWYRFPFSMRNSVLWSPFLKAWFSPEDESAIECMMRLPDYEPIDWVTPSRDGVFLDVGAYIGPYSLLAARSVGPRGKILAMEPDPVNRRQLERNLALNEIDNCTVIPCAAWSRSGGIGWCTSKEPVWHGIDVNQIAETVDARTIDEVVLEMFPGRLDWIKMDIEGGEIEALKGAEKTLARFRPRLFIEVHETVVALRELLASLNYRIEREAFDEPPDHHGWILASAR
jgi:FkbM family methyltransferase